MSDPNTLKNVPKHEVGKQVQGFVDFRAKKLEAQRQPDGRWTIRVLETD
jgi:hypothetical protein